MKIENYQDFLPKEESVKKYRKIVDDRYQIIYDDYIGQKLVVVDDKMNFLSGNFKNKSRLLARIFWDLQRDENWHEPSVRKAIKDWINDNTQE